MTLGEKICTLRTGKGLSQEDLAAKLEVSRQSVSKWETGQSVPDLEKIIKLADLFGVSVDELVREGERPQPPQPEAKVVYVKEKREWTAAQKLGICLLAAGGALTLLGLAYGGALPLVGVALLVLGLPKSWGFACWRREEPSPCWQRNTRGSRWGGHVLR